MAYPTQRSCNQSLFEGMTDGAYKKAAINRGGFIEPTYEEYRRVMSGAWHGYSETHSKVLPDGRIVSTRNYADVAPMDGENI